MNDIKNLPKDGIPHEAFCKACGGYSPIIMVGGNKVSVKLINTEFTYPVITAHCGCCFRPVYVPSLFESNADAFTDAYDRTALEMAMTDIMKKENTPYNKEAVKEAFDEVKATIRDNTTDIFETAREKIRALAKDREKKGGCD